MHPAVQLDTINAFSHFVQDLAEEAKEEAAKGGGSIPIGMYS